MIHGQYFLKKPYQILYKYKYIYIIVDILSYYLILIGLVKGLNQVGKSLDKKDAYLVILANDCDDPKYKKLISALAK